MTAAQPIQNRIVVLDVLRGFALFGVLLVNMLDFSSSALRVDTLGTRGTHIDQIVDVLIAFFAITKFYLLFSFLFGVGFAVQMRRTEGSGRSFVGIYLRRLAVLLVIGFAHALLLWDGDILRLYAVAGVMLLLLRRAPTRVLIGIALVIALGALIYFGMANDLAQVSEMHLFQDIELFRTGTYLELVNQRANASYVLDIQVPMVFVMFLLGLVVGREGFLEQPERYQPFLRRWWKWALPVGLIGSTLMLIGYAESSMWQVSIGVHIGAPALSFVYACAVLLHARKLTWLAPVGQMALSNYLTHSLVCTTLFYGYGFGWYDQLSPLATFGLVLIIYGAQIVISRWWMKRFRFGLMEWVWRSLTYWKLQPMLRSA